MSKQSEEEDREMYNSVCSGDETEDDEERIKSWDVRYSFGKVKEALESIKEMYHFVDDSRNESNVPNVMVREIHYGDDK